MKPGAKVGVIVFFGAIVVAMLFLMLRPKDVELPWDLIQPEMRDIQVEQKLSGTLVPANQVALRPEVSGIVEKIFVKVGDEVKPGDAIAKIRVVPDPVQVEQAKSQKKMAYIRLVTDSLNWKRQKALFAKEAIPATELEQSRRVYELSLQDYQSSVNHLKLLTQGQAGQGSLRSIYVRATIPGTVLQLQVKEGSSVIERNQFSEGTGIGVLADLDSLVFEAKVSEHDMLNLQEGMVFPIALSANKEILLNARLDFISPQGVAENGTIKFEIKAGVIPEKLNFELRSGMSAVAQIVMQEKKNVLAIEERGLLFEKDSIYAEVKQIGGGYRKLPVKGGLSDGIYIEIESGITKDDKVRIPE